MASENAPVVGEITYEIIANTGNEIAVQYTAVVNGRKLIGTAKYNAFVFKDPYFNRNAFLTDCAIIAYRNALKSEHKTDLELESETQSGGVHD